MIDERRLGASILPLRREEMKDKSAKVRREESVSMLKVVRVVE